MMNTSIYGQNIYLDIEEIYGVYPILEEWLHPGKYSPVNMFDNDINTAHVQENYQGKLLVEIQFKSAIKCDEIKLLGGNAKNYNLFKKYNRPKALSVWLYDTSNSFIENNVKLVKEANIKDEMKYQSIKFKDEYSIKHITLSVYDVYKGTQYNNTCITELKFYNKGKEIPVLNVNRLKKKYIQFLEDRLKNFFKYGEYNLFEEIGKVYTKTNGEIEIKSINIDDPNNDIYKYEYPDKYEIKDSRLYLFIKGEKYLANYHFSNINYKFNQKFVRLFVTSIYKDGKSKKILFDLLIMP